MRQNLRKQTAAVFLGGLLFTGAATSACSADEPIEDPTEDDINTDRDNDVEPEDGSEDQSLLDEGLPGDSNDESPGDTSSDIDLDPPPEAE